MTERTERDPDGRVQSSDLRNAHNEWAKANGADELSKNALAERMTRKKYERTRQKGRVFWCGLRLTSEGRL